MEFKVSAAFLLFIISTVCKGQITIPINTTPGSTTVSVSTTTLFPLPEISTTTSSAPSTSTSTQSTSTNSTPNPSNPCYGIAEGQIPYPENCNMFYTCDNSTISIIHTCPPNQIFYEGSCIWGDLETCLPFDETTTSQTPQTSTSTTLSQSITTNTNTPPTPTNEPFNPCENIESGDVPDLWNCTIYYTCDNSIVTIIRVCQPGQFFLNGRCQTGEISQCWAQPEPTTVSTSTVQPSNPCEGNPGQIIPDPNRCDGFIVCALSEPSYVDCPPRTVFNATTNQCVDGNPVTCVEYNFNAICNGVFFAARPFPDDDSLFIGCIRSSPSQFQCDLNEYFDSENMACIHRETLMKRNFVDIMNFSLI